jgi:hypothetical protein
MIKNPLTAKWGERYLPNAENAGKSVRAEM